jgi:hypothetical protein
MECKMSEKKAFITMGKTKTSKFFNWIFLLFLIGWAISKSGVEISGSSIADNVVSATFHEVIVPSAWFPDYSKERMIKLLGDFQETEISKKIISSVNEQGINPDINVDIYQDHVDGESELGWIVRFEVATANIGRENSQSIATSFGRGFGAHMKTYSD